MKKSMKLLVSLQAAVMLGAASLPVQQAHAESQGSSVTFTDVKSHWSADSVSWAVDKNIVSGYADGTFQPDKPVTEAEFLSMLIHVYKPDLQSGSSNWAEPYYELSSSLNYPVDAQDINTHNEPITRVRVAELIASTRGMYYVGDDAIRYMYGQGLAQGEAVQPTIAGFNGSDTLTRAEAVQFMKNLSEHGLGELLARPEQSSDTSVLPAVPSGDEDAEADQAQSGTSVNANDPVTDNSPVLKLDDQPILFKTNPVIQDGTVYFPIQEICAAFGLGYKENSDGSVTTTNFVETNTFRDGDTDHFVHYNPDGAIDQEEDIPLDGLKPMKKINGVFMMPAESLDHIWFAVKNEAAKFAELLRVTNGREDKSALKFYRYKQYVLKDIENMDGTNRQPDHSGFPQGDPSQIYRTIWVKEYALPGLGSVVYATWRWSSKDNLYYKYKEIEYAGEIVNGVAKGALTFRGDITYYQENYREEQLKQERLIGIELPYENGDIKMTWNDALNLFSKNNIDLPK